MAQSTWERQKGATSPSGAVDLRAVPAIRAVVPVVPAATTGFQQIKIDFSRLGPLALPPALQQGLRVITDPATGLPIFIRGRAAEATAVNRYKTDLENEVFGYLESIRPTLGLAAPMEEFEIASARTDALGHRHVRLRQVYEGLPIYGAEVVLHNRKAGFDLLNGRYYPTPEMKALQPALTEGLARETAWEHVRRYAEAQPISPAQRQLLTGPVDAVELVIYHPGGDPAAERLTWVVTVTPNVLSRWRYFIDAQDGSVLHHYNLVCSFHHPALPEESHDEPLSTGHRHGFQEGPVQARARDLRGVDRTIEVYQTGGGYFMIDATRAMYRPAFSRLPNDPVGAVWTIDARNTSPQRQDFATYHVASADNTWPDPSSVSAHYNAGLAYDYYYNTFNRNSINGEGGTIISIINVADESGQGMDNAFWNGTAMFYGNGRRDFTSPLARSLDVAGHEMSHGVIQNTANLEYYGESGALNESFADIFGVMMDRDDWQLGEEVVNTFTFRTGALRDMANPNNGGRRLGDPGWQPASTSEQYFGEQDNAGVHINSGIPNHAYYLFAEQVGKQRAEQVYYRALDVYLVRSSQFVDLRAAVLQAAQDLYGQAAAAAAAAAFDAVGIRGAGGNDYQTDIDLNLGDDYIILADAGYSGLSVVTPQGDIYIEPMTNDGLDSRPASVTDDGSIIVYVAADKTLRQIIVDDWASKDYREFLLDDQLNWRNAAISKDGARLAAVTEEQNNVIFIFDLISGNGQAFELYNPTFTQGIQTGDVLFADALEWDFSGQYVMYDARNRFLNADGYIEYFDIGFLEAWNNSTNSFGSGTIEKLFTTLPENVSVGNATFAKNSPYIIAVDLGNELTGEEVTLGVNIQTGDIGVLFENEPGTIGYPSFSPKDDFLVLDTRVNGSDIVSLVPLAEDKLSPAGNPIPFIGGATKAEWFATGARMLTDLKPLEAAGARIEVFPNPFHEHLILDMDLESSRRLQVQIFDLVGRRLHQQNLNAPPGAFQQSINLAHLPAGAYLLRVQTEGQSAAQQIVKLN